jgi:hypothetical protein
MACDESEHKNQENRRNWEISRLRDRNLAAKAETVRLALWSIPSGLSASSELCCMGLDSTVAGADLVDANEGFLVKY